MRYSPRHVASACAATGISTLILVAGSAAGQSGTASANELLKEPTVPLDSRVKPEKITESEIPPLPTQIVAPRPVTHQVATDPAQVPIDRAHWDKAQEAIKRGLAFLKSRQGESGAWMGEARAQPTDQPDKPSPVAVAVTALALKAIAQAEPKSVGDESIQKAVAFVRKTQTEDGSFEGGALSNYVTSAVVSALSAIGRSDFDREITLATRWLTTSQWDQSEGIGPRQDWFGGSGYGNHGRPDLSNTQMMLDSLYDSGMSPDEPAFQKAVAFISRAQNLQATNKLPWTGNDGGFVYTAANGGESFGSETAGEGRYGEKPAEGQPRSLRSYGSMTYAGFKSMLYAGLTPDDQRVKACLEWISSHWTFEENPGVGQQGLYYYYHTMGRALQVSEKTLIADAAGVNHNWREELIDAIVKRQTEDGSWVNTADRWMEGEPVLVTTYALLALEEALKPSAAAKE
jgi:squalene-hopene/tetraprenyl-beta-curcumene cyclase